MTDEERALWTVVAQILPVLGLALVLEARTLAQAYQQQAGKRQKRPSRFLTAPRFQLMLLVACGLAIAIGLLAAIGVLRRDEPPGPLSETIVLEFAVPVAVVALLVNPLVNIIAAGGVRWIEKFQTLRTRRSERRVMRLLGKHHRRVSQFRSKVFKELGALEERLAEARALRLELEEKNADPSYFDRLREAVERLEVSREFARGEFRSYVVEELNLLRFRRELRRRLRERKESYHGIEVKTDVVTGQVAVSGSPTYALPDDGGFLSEPLPLPDLPPYSHRPNLISDPEDFYARRVRH